MTEIQQEENISAKLQKIADHLVYLEKKIDSLIEKSSSQNSFRPYGGSGFRPRPRDGQGAPYGAPRREGYRPPQRNYTGPTGAHGTRTARYEGSGGGAHAHRPHRAPFQKKFGSHRPAR